MGPHKFTIKDLKREDNPMRKLLSYKKTIAAVITTIIAGLAYVGGLLTVIQEFLG